MSYVSQNKNSDKDFLGYFLGLFMAHKLLEKYRARIDANSVKGKGTTFVITIPRNGGEINE